MFQSLSLRMAYPMSLSSLSYLWYILSNFKCLLFHLLLIELLQALTSNDFELLVCLGEFLTHLDIVDLVFTPYLKLLVAFVP